MYSSSTMFIYMNDDPELTMSNFAKLVFVITVAPDIR